MVNSLVVNLDHITCKGMEKEPRNENGGRRDRADTLIDNHTNTSNVPSICLCFLHTSPSAVFVAFSHSSSSHYSRLSARTTVSVLVRDIVSLNSFWYWFG